MTAPSAVIAELERYTQKLMNYTVTRTTWTTWRIAGCILLALPAAMILISFLDQAFHFTGTANGSNTGDLGIIFVVWFGISLARGNITHRWSALALSCFYLLAFTVLAVVGPLMPPSNRALTIFVPISNPQIWHYVSLWLLSIYFFGVPAFLLYRKNQNV